MENLKILTLDALFPRKSVKKFCERAVENSLKAIFSFINKRFSVRFDRRKSQRKRQWDGDLHFAPIDVLISLSLFQFQTMTNSLLDTSSTLLSQVLTKVVSNLNSLVVS